MLNRMLTRYAYDREKLIQLYRQLTRIHAELGVILKESEDETCSERTQQNLSKFVKEFLENE